MKDEDGERRRDMRIVTHTHTHLSRTKASSDAPLVLMAVTILKTDVTAQKTTAQVSRHYVYYLRQWLN